MNRKQSEERNQQFELALKSRVKMIEAEYTQAHNAKYNELLDKFNNLL